MARLNAGGQRWFLALWPDPEVRDALARVSRGLMPGAARRTHPEDLHLTLRFLGPLSPEALTQVEGAAETLAGMPCVHLRIDRLGHFPRSGILWAGPAVVDPGLRALAARLDQALGARGFPPEVRPFQAHITLARGMRRPPADPWGEPVPWIARELVLAAGQEGQVPRYRVRRSWPLDGSREGCQEGAGQPLPRDLGVLPGPE